MCYLGVIAPGSASVESPEDVSDALVRASKFIPKDRLATTDDYGFIASWIPDESGGRSYEHHYEIVFQKIANRVEGTRRAAEILGVG